MLRDHTPVCITFLLVSMCQVATSAPPRQPWYPQAPPLPPPTGEVLRVETVSQLFAAAEQVAPGGTIVLADGVYAMPRYFELHTDNVTLRSERGQRDSVVLDGTDSQDGELVGVSHCSGVTIADLTIQNIKWNGFKINSNLHATRVTIRNCVIHNIWQRGVKGPAMDPQDRGKVWPTDCRIEYCLFYNDRPEGVCRRSGRHARHVWRQLRWRHRCDARQRVDHSRQCFHRHPRPHGGGPGRDLPMERIAGLRRGTQHHRRLRLRHLPGKPLSPPRHAVAR